MLFNTWTPAEVSSNAAPWRGAIWRIVESQHVASTMRLVDTLAEQDVLEAILEDSKPSLSSEATKLDYLLATPFRYYPTRPGSRFRAVSDPGVYYGADTVRTAAAELGYWRWKFLTDSVDLDRLEPVAHTAFRAAVSTTCIDLRQEPFNRDTEIWTHPSSYDGTQAFARTAREAQLGAILYRSVRNPSPAWCLALLTPAAFARTKPDPDMQSWWLAVSRREVLWRRESESFAFAMSA